MEPLDLATLIEDRRDDATADETRPWAAVPWRTIIATVFVVVVTALALVFLYRASRVLVLASIAGFFAVVLAPPVERIQRALHVPRSIAVGLALLMTVAVVGGMVTLFLLPVRTQLVDVLTDLPGTVQQAARGQGPVGHLVSKLGLEQLVEDNRESLTRNAESIQRSLPGLVTSALTVTLAIITVLVMTALMLTQSAALARTATKAIPMRHRDLVQRMGGRAAAAVSGYMIGNLFISVCAGAAAFLFLLFAGVPSPVLLALWVAFADLIPLVGATLGALVAVIAALTVSPATGIAAVVFFALYQQFENSVLQIVVMSRTVRVNPLAVLLSVLLGVELFGFLGALLAIPIAGAVTVVAKELWLVRPVAPDELLVVRDQHVSPDRVDSLSDTSGTDPA
jgi:predicted PurR-regulated permease PerM